MSNTNYFIPQKDSYYNDFTMLNNELEIVYDELRRLLLTPKKTDLRDPNYGTKLYFSC